MISTELVSNRFFISEVIACENASIETADVINRDSKTSVRIITKSLGFILIIEKEAKITS